jgi:hypothetical protein
MDDSLVIKFKAIDSYAYNVALPPVPATSYIPKWWKDLEVRTSANLMSKPGDVDAEKTYVHTTGKRCFPMLDALTSGYILPLWADVEVSYVDENPQLKWLTDRGVFTYWYPEFTEGMEHPEDCVPIAFKFSNQYIIETPPGWSCLFTQPHGYPNLPFRTIPGVVDTDVLKTDVNQPIWLRKGFTGVIPKGTPIAQILPFQRQDWSHEVVTVVEEMKENEHYYNQQKYIKTTAGGAYGHNQRQNKSYE